MKKTSSFRRHLIQLYAALLYNAHARGFIEGEIYTGSTKAVCLPGLNCYSCPAASFACPLGALQNALASTGNRAPWYMAGILVLFGVILGRTVCGWLCPVGLVQDVLHKIPSVKIRKTRFTRVLSRLKYVILIVFVVLIPLYYATKRIPLPAFCKYICPAGTLEGAVGLLSHPVNEGLFGLLGILFTRKVLILVLLLTGAVFIYRIFCRFLCPLGAIYSLFNRFSLVGMRVNPDTCTRCGACTTSCQMDVLHVGDTECIQCGECIDHCPQKAITLCAGRIVLKDADLPGEKMPAGSGAAASEAEGSRNHTVSQSSSFFRRFPAARNGVRFVALLLLTAVVVYTNFPLVRADSTEYPSSSAQGVGENETSGKSDIPGAVPGSSGDDSFPADNPNRPGETFTADESPASPGNSSGAGTSPSSIAGNAAPRPSSKNSGIEACDRSAPGGKYDSTAPSPENTTEPAAESAPDSPKETASEPTLESSEADPALSAPEGHEIGERIPDFTLISLDGEAFTLSEKRGKMVILNLWATWCTPCVNELPHFDRIGAEHPEDVAILAIHSDLITDNVADYLSNFDYTIPFAIDESGEVIASLGGSTLLPQTIVLDRNGIVTYNSVGSVTYEKLAALVREASGTDLD